MGIETAIAVGLVAAAVGSTTASIVGSRKSDKAAKSAQEDAANRQKQLEGDLASRRANEESDANKLATRDKARQRQAALAKQSTGRGDTILTSPLGDVGEAAGQQKTLLGS